MKIQDVAKRFDLSTDTLRYYEKIGLIDPVAKNKSGHRDYSEYDLYRIEFLKRMRAAGCSIDTLKAFVDLYNIGPKTIPQRQQLLRDQLKRLNEEIEQLNIAKTYLEEQIAYYDDNMIVRDTHSRLLKKNKQE
ncbi:MAG: MerR family transcriptional regulator [Erysipelotrichaceae bacterium]|nr:MerR family transcriptional regulator [Erysipelotrichaceae bacterium]